MKKSEMILRIASDIVINKPHINFKEAQELAEITLNTAIQFGMQAPISEVVDTRYTYFKFQWEEE